jgi:ribosomal protein RSM22 (predicted rRNA methylase)
MFFSEASKSIILCSFRNFKASKGFSLQFKNYNSVWCKFRKLSTTTSLKQQMTSKFKFAAIQPFVTDNKEQNLLKARELIKEAAEHGARVIALPVYNLIIRE